MWRRPLFSVPSSLTSSKSLSLTLQGEIQQPTVQYAHCPGLTEHLSISLWQKHATSAVLTCLRVLGNGPYRVTMQQYVSSFKNRHCGATRENAFRIGCPNIPFSAQSWNINDDDQYPDDPFVALADFKVVLEKDRKRTVHELLRKTPSSLGTKLLTASTALRACRNRHLGTLMHCCEAWELVGKCFDQCSFECIDFHGLGQVIASLTRETVTEREAEIRNFPWTQTEKQCLGEVQARSTRQALQETNALLPRCYRRRPPSGK